MNSSLYSSKEEIRNRIIKRAQELWGIEKVYDFDPLVVLMMEVLSSELFHITNDVNNLENRIFDKISRILAADNLVAPLPAHAIIQVQPSEDRILVKPNLHFFVKKKLGSVQGAAAEKAIEIDFSALHTAPLFNGRIRYMATSQSLYEMLPAQKKLIAKGTLPAEVHTIYLGIAYQGEDKRRAYQGLNFYFDWGNYQVSRETYTLLALSKWSLNEKPIKAFRDRFMEDSFHRVESDVFHRKHFLNILKQDVEAFYNDRFLTLEDNLDAEDLFSVAPSLPEFVSRRYDAALFDQDEQNLDWVRIDVPASIDYKLLDELYIHLNAIPVVNKRAVTSRNRLNVTRNIVPIKTEDMEQLLTVEQMMDKDGMLYSEIPYTSNLPSTAAGYYTIRHGSVERLDPRSAKDMVDYLFELIRDEKAAFSHYNADFLNRILVDLDKSLALIQQKSKLSNAHIKELQNYIVVNPKNENDLMFMTVWLTYAELANGTPVGSLLQSRSNNHITTEPIHFLSSSTGGRSRLGRVDSVQAFKYGITSSDKIVTKNDILNFVKYNLGSKVKRVTMGSGVQMDSSSTRGFYKTLDLMIEPHPQHGLASNEWEELLDQTLIKLIARSTIQVKYRIKLQVGSVT